MTFLLKPTGDADEIYTKIMTDWRALDDKLWSIRPIAVGNAHDRTISRARLRASKPAVKKHFQGEEIGQYAFGAERGGEMLVLAQQVHQDLEPEDAMASEDGINAYNNAQKDKIAKGMLESDYKEVARLHRYFLRAHIRPTKIYIAGHKQPIIIGVKGVKQGDPAAGVGYSMGQHDMLLELHSLGKEKGMPVRIGAIVDDIAMQGRPSHVAFAHEWLRQNGERWGYLLNEKPGKSTIVPGPEARRESDPAGEIEGKNRRGRRSSNSRRGAHLPRAVRREVRAGALAALDGIGTPTQRAADARTKRIEERKTRKNQ